MHGLILAGGEGSRLAASGVATPKALVPVGGVPQLVRLARTFERLGCASLTCMVRDGVGLEPIADNLARLSVPLNIHSCLTPSSLHTLVLGLGHAPPGDVFCSMVDTVMPTADWVHAYATSRRTLATGADAVLAVTPFIDDERPLFAACSDDQRVTSIGDDSVTPARVTGGVYAFGPRARAAALAALASGHSRMRALLAGLVRQGYDVRAVEVAKIIDLDCRDDLDGANAWLEFCEGGGLPMA
jgi:molybdopterin-guanine dinucleotide biosynthesis protein A